MNRTASRTLIILLIISISSLCSGQEKEVFKPIFRESKKTTHKIPEGQNYTFGYLEVQENRKKHTSQTIKIPVYIFKSRSETPKKDPIIYTVGGPGSTTMPSAQYMKYYKYLDDRDFILIEQRGNLYAEPHLDCPDWSKAVFSTNLPSFNTEKTDSLFGAAARTCRETLTQRGIDLDGYNTNEIAADIHDLVSILGIDEYNLLTISYSTKIAQVLLRDYPERIRSVVMDSPLPLEVNYDEESVKNLLEAIDKVLHDCEIDVNCHDAFPNLKERFYKYLEQKTKDPLVVTVTNPETEKIETFYLKGSDLITVFTSASTRDVQDIPFEIEKLLNDDLSSIKAQLLNLFKKPGQGAGIGMRLSVWCAEEHPFNSQELIAEETRKYPQIEGLFPSVFTREVCNIWNVQKVSDIENQAVKSDIPALLISGEYDNETPWKWAESMQKNLSNSFHLVFMGWKHTPTTNWANQCAMQAANDFFNNPEVKPLPECFVKIESPSFKLD